MDIKTYTEEHFVVAAGHEAGPVFLSQKGMMVARPLLAQTFKTQAEAATAGMAAAKKIAGGKDLDWRVFGIRTTSQLTPT